MDAFISVSYNERDKSKASSRIKNQASASSRDPKPADPPKTRIKMKNPGAYQVLQEGQM